jgi:hypothetical protein
MVSKNNKKVIPPPAATNMFSFFSTSSSADVYFNLLIFISHLILSLLINIPLPDIFNDLLSKIKKVNI